MQIEEKKRKEREALLAAPPPAPAAKDDARPSTFSSAGRRAGAHLTMAPKLPRLACQGLE